MIKTITSYQTADGVIFDNLQQARMHEGTLKKRYKVILEIRATYTTTIHALDKDEALTKAQEEWFPEDLDFEDNCHNYAIEEIGENEKVE